LWVRQQDQARPNWLALCRQLNRGGLYNHLPYRGRVLLRTVAAPVAIEVSGGEVLRVPPAALVGWTGAMTPRIGLLSGADPALTPPSPGSPVVVELTGDGRVLVDPDAIPAD
jgi:uncharacterized protein (AIM24 family)